LSIIYSVDKLEETQNVYAGYMQDRIKKLNAEQDVQISLEVMDAQGSVDKQISDVQTALIKKPQAMIFSAVDAVGSLPAVQAAQDAGVITLDFRPSEPEPDAYDIAFGVSEAQLAQNFIDYLKGNLEKDPSLVYKIALIYGGAAQTPQLIRMNAVKDLAKEMPDRVKILAETYGDWATDKAQNATADFLEAHPDINLVACANEGMSIGANNALVKAGIRDRVAVTGYDISKQVLDDIEAGVVDWSTGGLGPDYGQVIDAALKAYKGEFTDRVYALDPVYTVTKENVAEVRAALNKG
jgi:ABC-type sugar transport system substrate-binding protein